MNALRSASRFATRGLYRPQRALVGRMAPRASFQTIRSFSTEDVEKPKKEISPEVSALVDEIVKLNLLQVSELVEELNTRLDLPAMPAGGMMMPMGGMPMPAAGGDAAAAEEAVEEVKPIVNIQLDSYDASAKIKIIKEVKNISGLGLKEAKAAVEGVPTTILSDVKREEAEAIVKTIEELGGKASLI
mmetsp:Transcript_869/g.1391  ORF Transcript_869/g.1391 Transcript_869/m.1391 type:complete len:188 (+) Transcript_869:219-782(+)